MRIFIDKGEERQWPAQAQEGWDLCTFPWLYIVGSLPFPLSSGGPLLWDLDNILNILYLNILNYYICKSSFIFFFFLCFKTILMWPLLSSGAVWLVLVGL